MKMIRLMEDGEFKIEKQNQLRDLLLEYHRKLKTNKNVPIPLNRLVEICGEKKRKVLIDELLQFFLDEILEYQYEDDYHYLLAIFPIIGTFMDEFQFSKEMFEKKIEQIKQAIVAQLKQKPGHLKKNHPNYLFLKELLSQLDSLQLAFLTGLSEAYHGDKYPIVHYFIFEDCQIASLKMALKKIPYLVTMVDQQGVSLFSHIVDHYLMELTDYLDRGTVSNLERLLYYDKVIELFLMQEPFQDEKFIPLKKEQLLKLKKYLGEMKQKKYSEKQERKLLTFVNQCYERIASNRPLKLTKAEKTYEYDVHTQFPRVVSRIARKMDKPIDLDKFSQKRIITDCDETIITIDGIGAKEIDDGFSIQKLENGNYLLRVHIADVLAYCPIFNDLLKEAEARGTSLYLKNRSIPMIPEILSSGRMSLKAGNFRHVKTFQIEIDSMGNVLLDRFFMENNIVQVHDNLSYGEANRILKSGFSEDKKIMESIALLSELSSKMSKHFSIEQSYQEVNHSSQNDLSNHEIFGNSASEKIVQFIMLLVNETLAKKFYLDGYPFVYRNHFLSPERKERIEQLERELDLCQKKWISSLEKVKEILPKSYYDLNNVGHWGIGVDAYCHATSPLRRYADILAHHCINSCYFEPVTDQKVYTLQHVIKKSTKRLNSRINLSQDYMDSLFK